MCQAKNFCCFLNVGLLEFCRVPCCQPLRLTVSGRFGLLPVRPPPVRPLTRSAPYPFGPLIYNASPGLSVTESAWSERYPLGPLPWYIQLYYRPTTTTLNRETQLQVAENYLSEQPAHLLLGLHCENRPE